MSIVKCHLLSVKFNALLHNLFHGVGSGLKLGAKLTFLSGAVSFEVLGTLKDLLFLDCEVIKLILVLDLFLFDLSMDFLHFLSGFSCFHFTFYHLVPYKPHIFKMVHLNLVKISRDLRLLPLVVKFSLIFS